MAYTVDEIATALGAKAHGTVDLLIEGAAEPADAQPQHLALAMSPEYAESLPKGRARAAMLWNGADWQAMGLEAAITVARPRYAMAGLTRMLDPGPGWETGIHPTAVIDASATLGEGVSVGPLAVIGARAKIGAGCAIGPQCFVGSDAVIGADSILREGARICARVQVGARLIAQPGSVIGADGFSFVTPELSAVEAARKTLGDQGDAKAQSYARIHSLGAVTVGEDVELGANSTIDRGTVRNTVIGDRTKIDNQVQIGHNCRVGTDCLICGQAGLAGSVTVGNNVVLGGKAGLADNITLGDNVIASGGAKIISNVPAGRVVMGYPATKMETQLEIYRYQRRLKRLFADVAALKKAVSKDG